MYVINKEGDRKDFVYSSHDRFLEDINHYISENRIFEISRNNTIGLLDLVCGHLNYWKYKSYNDNQQAKLIYNDFFQQNEVINRLIKLGDPIPELVIYEFRGISVYDELNGRNVIQKESYEILEVQLEINGILFLSAKEFAELGGEITFPEDEDDEIEIYLSCWGDVYFFMTESDEKEMGEYMLECIVELNKIYSTQGLQLIDLKD